MTVVEGQQRIYTEQSPAVQRMADRLESKWNKLRGALLNNPRYKAQAKHRKVFEKAAVKVLTLDLNPDLFVEAQLRTPADATRCQPTFLTGPKAIDRYKSFINDQRPAYFNSYIAQLNFINRLREIGRSWEDIDDGAYSLTPLVLWAMLYMNGLEDRAGVYYESAKAELAKCPDLVELFGPSLARLK